MKYIYKKKTFAAHVLPLSIGASMTQMTERLESTVPANRWRSSPSSPPRRSRAFQRSPAPPSAGAATTASGGRSRRRRRLRRQTGGDRHSETLSVWLTRPTGGGASLPGWTWRWRKRRCSGRRRRGPVCCRAACWSSCRRVPAGSCTAGRWTRWGWGGVRGGALERRPERPSAPRHPALTWASGRGSSACCCWRPRGRRPGCWGRSGRRPQSGPPSPGRPPRSVWSGCSCTAGQTGPRLQQTDTPTLLKRV